MRAATCAPRPRARAAMRRRSRKCSPPATCGAGNRWWSGRSARDASARARSMLSSWAARTCRADPRALKTLLIALVLGYAGIACVVWLVQERLLFYPRQAPVDATRVAIHGRSLGSGVAVQLAAARPVKCVVLTSPFASALDVGREMYPWLPVALLLRHPFDSATRAPALRVPLLVLVGEADRLIAPHHSERLAGLWGGPVERMNLPGFGHNDLDLDPRYAQAIRAFLDRHL